MKKWLKITLIVAGALILIPVFALWIIHEPLPKTEPSEAADRLAREMLAAVDKPAWDTTHWIQWTFAGRNSFVWDRDRHLVQVSWGDKKVLIDPEKNTGTAYIDGQLATKQNGKLVKKAMASFFNDSFWLLAPTKAFDPGTTRSVVELDGENDRGLLVTYSSGGVTPGDSYLWLLDEKGLPKAFKMWVSVIPVGGLKASWENWQTLPSGARYAASHKVFGLDVAITDVKSGDHWSALGLKEDPFKNF